MPKRLADDLLFDPTAEEPQTKKRKTRKRAKRAPSLKSKLVADLRARKKKLDAELKIVNRDLNSLICRRKKKDQ